MNANYALSVIGPMTGQLQAPTLALTTRCMIYEMKQPEMSRFHFSHSLMLISFAFSYPSSTVIPLEISDDEIRLLSQCHRNGRYPVVTWMHPTNNSLLVRASAMRSRVMSVLFKHSQSKGDSLLRLFETSQSDSSFRCFVADAGLLLVSRHQLTGDCGGEVSL